MLCLTVVLCYSLFFIFCFKQKTAYEMRISDWSSDVCSSDLERRKPDLALVSDLTEQRQRVRSDGNGVIGTCPQRPLRRVAQGIALHILPTKIGRASCRERVCQYV